MAIGIKIVVGDNGRITEHFYHIKKENQMTNQNSNEEVVNMDEEMAIDESTIDEIPSEPDSTLDDADDIEEDDDDEDDDDDDLDDEDETEEIE